MDECRAESNLLAIAHLRFVSDIRRRYDFTCCSCAWEKRYEILDYGDGDDGDGDDGGDNDVGGVDGGDGGDNDGVDGGDDDGGVDANKALQL